MDHSIIWNGGAHHLEWGSSSLGMGEFITSNGGVYHLEHGNHSNSEMARQGMSAIFLDTQPAPDIASSIVWNGGVCNMDHLSHSILEATGLGVVSQGSPVQRQEVRIRPERPSVSTAGHLLVQSEIGNFTTWSFVTVQSCGFVTVQFWTMVTI